MPAGLRDTYDQARKEAKAPLITETAYATIAGDKIWIECRKPAKWQLVQGSGQHKAMHSIASMNAMAVLLTKYTNRRN